MVSYRKRTGVRGAGNEAEMCVQRGGKIRVDVEMRRSGTDEKFGSGQARRGGKFRVDAEMRGKVGGGTVSESVSKRMEREK